MTADEQAREAVMAILSEQADHEWNRDDPTTADRIIATLREMGCLSDDRYHKSVHRQLAAMTSERDALRAQIEGMTSDEAVEAAADAFWNDTAGEAMKAAIAAAVAAAKGEGW